MPKRIVDGDAIWTSNRIKAVMPIKFRAEYANLLPLALANGVFECDPYLIWTKVYSFNRPDVSADDVKSILDEYERVGLIFRFGEREAKEWAFFVGIDKIGRLPPPTQMARMERGPEPPNKALREFIQKTKNPSVVLGQSSLGLGLVGVGFGREGEGLGLPSDRLRQDHSGASLSPREKREKAERETWLKKHGEKA